MLLLISHDTADGFVTKIVEHYRGFVYPRYGGGPAHTPTLAACLVFFFHSYSPSLKATGERTKHDVCVLGMPLLHSLTECMHA